MRSPRSTLSLLSPVILLAVGCGVLEPDARMVEVDVTGRITIDDTSITSTPVILQYVGCELGGTCGDGRWHVVAEARTDSDGRYHLRGQVPEQYCSGGAGRVTVGLPLGSDLLSRLRWSVYWLPMRTCGRGVLDFTFSCLADLPADAPECVVPGGAREISRPHGSTGRPMAA